MAAKKQSNQESSFQPVYVIHGKDRRSALENLQTLTGTILADADPQVCLSDYDSSAEWADVIDDLCTLPFLSERRLVVIKDADPFVSRYRENLEAYLDKPSETGVLILLPDSFPKTTRLAKRIAKAGGLITCEPLKPRELPDFLIRYAKETWQLTLPRDGAAALVELVGDDSGMLVNEVDKLATYLARPAGGKKMIDLDLIHDLTGRNRQFNVFNVIDAMTTGATALALNRLDRMLAQDRDAQYTVVGAFAWHIRRLYNARLMLDQGQHPQAVIKQCRIWSQPDRFIGQVKALSIQKIAAILSELANLDFAVKTSTRSVKNGLEQLIIEFARSGKSRVA